MTDQSVHLATSVPLGLSQINSCGFDLLASILQSRDLATAFLEAAAFGGLFLGIGLGLVRLSERASKR